VPADPGHDAEPLTASGAPGHPRSSRDRLDPPTTVRVPSTDGVEVPVHDLGGDGPPLLLAHATGFHGMVWRPLARHLTGYHCWAPDLRGHGDATPPSEHGFDWHGFADDVLAVVDGLDLSRPAAVGHSKGGAALLLAEQRRPGTFRALYLYEPVVFPASPGLPGRAPLPEGVENPLAAGALRRRATFDSHESAFDNFATKPPFDALDPDALRAYVEHGFADQPDGSVRLKCEPADEAQVYRMGATHDAFDHLERVRCPVVVARGHVTDFGPATVAPAVAEALPHGRLEEHPSLGHFGPLERPDLVAARVTAFLDGLA
jgi:pimeloyl-ACP methyl ester carboxylesterase